jgi:N-acetylglucosaminyldiphosphoundecaprenol N-acetyl-beta-D-mannosaminyltransferase
MGIPIDRVSMDEAIDEIERLVQLGRVRSTTHQVVTVNVDFVVNAIGDADVNRILQQADLALADGMPLVWAASRIGMPIPQRVTGADLVPALAARSASTGLRIHLYGSADGIAERACALLIERNPGAQITADSGPMIRDPRHPARTIVEQIAGVGADVVCVAFGNPKQEHFIHAVRDHGAAPVMIGVGGTLDMLVGGRKRAPEWIQRVGMEWVFRAAQEPRRLGKRYAKDIFVFGPRLARFLWAARQARDIPPAQLAAHGDESVTVDLGGRDALTIADLGDLVAIRRAAHQSGVRYTVTGAGPALRTRLRRLRAEAALDD